MEENNVKVPKPNDAESLTDWFDTFVELVWVLRKNCPWDKRQTNESIAFLTIEETYEMVDAITQKDDEEFSRELGDLMLHVVMHAIMAEQRGAFDLKDVFRKIHEKLVHRHPHVFSEVKVEGEEDVVRNWEALKMKEGQKSILDGVPIALPALLRAERVQHKASKVGFDWIKKEDVWDKVEEELDEFKDELESGDKRKAFDELGDLMFAIVNYARFEGLMAEEALQSTNNKFSKRFQFIERKAAEMGKDLRKMTLEEMDEIWNEAKERERGR